MTGISPANPTATIIIREHGGKAYYEAKFRCAGEQVKRRIGPAWLDADHSGAWAPRKGRIAPGFYDERRAHVAAAEIVGAYVEQAGDRERVERERRARGITFRELAGAYMEWLESVRGAKPSTLRDYRSVLAEPNAAYMRGKGSTLGRVMGALGDRAAGEVTTQDVEALLAAVAGDGVSPRTVNKVREVVGAIYSFAIKKKLLTMTENPAAATDKRPTPKPGPLAYYSAEEVEALARAMESDTDGRQDSEAVRLSAYAGLRLGELLALRWRDVDFAGSHLTVGRALSAGVETSTKSRLVRQIPLPDQAAAALDRLSRRENFTGPGERVLRSTWAYPRRVGAPPALPKGAGHGGARSAPMARPAAHLRQPSRRGRRGPREDQERDGPQQHRNDRALPPRTSRNRAGRGVHASVRADA